MTKLYRWDTGETIHEHDGDIRATVEAAAKLGISCFRARLVSANLVSANLYGADLVSAILVSANLEGARVPIHCKWSVSYSEGSDGLSISIGCKTKTVAQRDDWFAGTDEYDTSRDSDDFRKIRANYAAMRAYLSALGKLSDCEASR